jgi:hypothetical protein
VLQSPLLTRGSLSDSGVSGCRPVRTACKDLEISGVLLGWNNQPRSTSCRHVQSTAGFLENTCPYQAVRTRDETLTTLLLLRKLRYRTFTFRWYAARVCTDVFPVCNKFTSILATPCRLRIYAAFRRSTCMILPLFATQLTRGNIGERESASVPQQQLHGHNMIV